MRQRRSNTVEQALSTDVGHAVSGDAPSFASPNRGHGARNSVECGNLGAATAQTRVRDDAGWIRRTRTRGAWRPHPGFADATARSGITFRHIARKTSQKIAEVSTPIDGRRCGDARLSQRRTSGPVLRDRSSLPRGQRRRKYGKSSPLHHCRNRRPRRRSLVRAREDARLDQTRRKRKKEPISATTPAATSLPTPRSACRFSGSIVTGFGRNTLYRNNGNGSFHRNHRAGGCAEGEPSYVLCGTASQPNPHP